MSLHGYFAFQVFQKEGSGTSENILGVSYAKVCKASQIHLQHLCHLFRSCTQTEFRPILGSPCITLGIHQCASVSYAGLVEGQI